MALKTSDQELLKKLAEGAPRASANVRALARFAANSRCATARLGFAARVDFDKLLAGTKHEAPFGQSPFAFRRGNRFEESLREDGHRPILGMLAEHFKYDATGAVVADLRDGRPPSQARADTTKALVTKIAAGKKGAPNLIDGAVLSRVIGGIPSLFEADAVAASFTDDIHVGEIKSFPTVDGQADPDKLGAALAQAAIYILLLKELVDACGGDPDRVSTVALLITPKNTGLRPTMTVKPTGMEIDRAARILDSVRPAEALDGLSSKTPGFGAVAEKGKRPEAERLETALCIVETVGTTYQPGCLSSCGFGKLCRARAQQNGDLSRIGPGFARLLPGVSTIDRVGELVAGGKSKPEEAAAAAKLRDTKALLDALTGGGR